MLLRCIERPDRYLVHVEWRKLSDHVDHYPSTPEAAEVRARLLPLIARASRAHFETAESVRCHAATDESRAGPSSMAR
jgi:heme-degrading monooxygenase HmoA